MTIESIINSAKDIGIITFVVIIIMFVYINKIKNNDMQIFYWDKGKNG